MNKYETNEQVRGKLVGPKFYISFLSRAEDNPTYYFDAETGAAVTNQFVYADGHWYYFGNDGKALLFDQVINGQHLYYSCSVQSRLNDTELKTLLMKEYHLDSTEIHIQPAQLSGALGMI